jgi:hypothetical protein
VWDKESKQTIKFVSVKINNSNFATQTDKNGGFELLLPRIKHYTLLFSHVSYSPIVKEISILPSEDTISLNILLNSKITELITVNINANQKPDTVFWTNKFSIIDFDFYEDKYILLTVDRKTDKPFVRLVDETQIISSFEIPRDAGKIKEVYHDFIGFSNVICESNFYRIIINNNKISLAILPMEDYNSMVKPIIDTLNNQLFFSNYDKDFPLFSYYSYNTKDSSKTEITSIENNDLMEAYRFEYYNLQPKDKLLARNLAQEYKVDKHVAAAYLSGFTKSMFYTPLFAPLYVVGDTICIFDHYKNLLFHYNQQLKKIDSIPINYHHPKNWRSWKNTMTKDLTTNSVYAIYNNSGYKFLKKINHITGKTEGTYKIIHHSAEKIKIKNEYIYYVYRPFESQQEKFLYKEKIVLNKD